MKQFFCLCFLWLILRPALAQQVISSATLPIGYKDNAAGTEIINTPSGQSVHFVPYGSFEHIGQFYVAGNGIYDGSWKATDPTVGFMAGATDYFGYAPTDQGFTGGPYLGSGIMGASSANGGSGQGTPRFGNLVVTSTGDFSAVAGIKIDSKLTFNHSPGSGSSIIKVPDEKRVSFGFYLNTVTGADDQNYIDGFVEYYFSSPGYSSDNLLYPLGDSKSPSHPYHPLTLTVTNLYYPGILARYYHTNPRPVTGAALGEGIRAVSTTGYWQIGGAGQFNNFTVSIPQPTGLGDNPNPANLRLVGWNGSQWVLVGSSPAVPPSTGASADLNGYLLGGGIPNHSSLYVTALAIGLFDATLPVNLVSFTGHYSPEGAQLAWQTSLETNNDHFEIQRSADAKSFETIGRLAGKGTSQALTDYSFVDESMPEGLSYYRLKQVDTDGRYEYSSIISIRYGVDDRPITLSLWPNPVKEILRLTLSNGSQPKEVVIYDLQGIMLRQSASIPEVATLPAGIYVLEVQAQTGQRIRQRFIKE